MQIPRSPRFKRISSAFKFEPTPRDVQIIRFVYKHRFLRSSQVVQLVGGSSQTVLRRLQVLYHSGYLERPRAQLDYYHRGGSREIVYGLGSMARGVLKRFEATAREERWGEKNGSVGRIFLEHAMLVSDVMVALEIACRQAAHVRFFTEEDLRLQRGSTLLAQPFRWRVSINNQLSLGVIPDRVFALEFQNQSGRQVRAFFFLEADRATMPVKRQSLSQTSFYRKLIAYEATWTQSLHKSLFGFNRFRVLTLTSSTERVRSLVECCSHLQRGHGLFLFADKSILGHPEGILSAKFFTGRAGEKCTLLD